MVALAAGSAEPPTTAIIGTPPQPTWKQLNPQQQGILAPLSHDWDSMENLRRRKWLGIAERYPSMDKAQQQRMQQRMREWADLTPEQRSKVRDTYKDFKQLPPEQKKTLLQKWEAYSNLPSEEKTRIRESGRSSQLLAPPAPPVESSEQVPATAPSATESAPR